MVPGFVWLVVAQASAGPAPVAPSEIIVTGERTRRTLRDTASSVEVFGRKRIEGSSADRVEQVLDLVPNVQMSSGGEGPTIRGQDTTGPSRDLYAFLGGNRPRTTLIVDGRAVSFNEFIYGISPLWDVDRVEVFRSPQTTTQGRNSIAGAIFINTADPTFSPEYAARGIIGTARTRELSVSGSGPIVPGQLAWRLAGDYRYSATSSVMADNIAGADPNHDEYGLLRAKLLATPAALPGSRIELIYSHSQSQMPQVEGVRAPFRKRRDPFASYGTFRSNVDSLTANFGYRDDRLAIDGILSAGDTAFRRFAPPGLGITQIHSRDWSGEVISNWTPAEALKVVGGVSHYVSTFRQVIDLSQLTGIGRFRDRQASSGAFGEASWTIARGATLTGGLRYQQDSQRRIGTLDDLRRPIPLNFNKTFHAWLPKLSFAYEPSRAVKFGALVERAYNPGGTTLRFDTGAADDFGAESLWDYEIFARAGLFGDALRLSGNFFYYQQHNAQRAQPITIIAPTGAPVIFANLFNLPRAHSYGAEVSAEWRASPSLSLRGGLGLLRTRVDDAGEAPAFEGVQFQRSPKLSASAGIDWNPVRRLRLSMQIRHNSGYFSDDLNTVARHVAGWTKLDARAEWTTGRFRFFGYARNVFDKFYLTYLFSPTFGTAGEPREAGVGVEARF